MQSSQLSSELAVSKYIDSLVNCPEEKRLIKKTGASAEGPRMTLKLIMSFYEKQFGNLPEEKKNQELMALEKLHLEYKGIPKIENLELFSNLSQIYLQGVALSCSFPIRNSKLELFRIFWIDKEVELGLG